MGRTWTAGLAVAGVLFLAMSGPAQAQAQTDGAPGERNGSKTMRVAGFSLMFVGIAAVSTGVVYGVEARARAGDLESVEGQWDTALDDDVDDMERYERNQLVAIGAGAAAIAVGGLLVYLGRDRGPVDVAPTVSGDGAGVVVQGRF